MNTHLLFWWTQVSGMVTAANTNQGESRAYSGGNRSRGLLEDKSDRTLLETRVEHLYQAFQRLIDWSIGEARCDVCAVISGPKLGFTRTTDSRLLKIFPG
jgi:hypothetical protein